MAQALTVVGTITSALGQIGEGNLAESRGRRSAAQYRQAADAAYAKGTRTASEIRRQGEMIKGDARAAVAAGGMVTDDAGTVRDLSNIEQVTEYNALTSLFEGEEEARGLRYAARMARWAGKQEKRASRLGAVTTTLSGLGRAYGMGE